MPLTYFSTSLNTTSMTSDFLKSDQSGSASSKRASVLTTTVYRFAKCVRPSMKTLLPQVQLGSPTNRPPTQNATPWCLIVLATSVESMNVICSPTFSLTVIVVCSTNPGSSVNGTDRSFTNTVNLGSWRKRAARPRESCQPRPNFAPASLSVSCRGAFACWGSHCAAQKAHHRWKSPPRIGELPRLCMFRLRNDPQSTEDRAVLRRSSRKPFFSNLGAQVGNRPCALGAS